MMEWAMGVLYLFWVAFWLGNSEAKWRDRIMMVLAPSAVVVLLAALHPGVNLLCYFVRLCFRHSPRFIRCRQTQQLHRLFQGVDGALPRDEGD